jgi:hypothetical protein
MHKKIGAKDGRVFFRDKMDPKHPALEVRIDALSLISVAARISTLARSVELDARNVSEDTDVDALNATRLQLAHAISDLRSVNAGCIVHEK